MPRRARPATWCSCQGRDETTGRCDSAAGSRRARARTMRLGAKAVHVLEHRALEELKLAPHFHRRGRALRLGEKCDHVLDDRARKASTARAKSLRRQRRIIVPFAGKPESRGKVGRCRREIPALHPGRCSGGRTIARSYCPRSINRGGHSSARTRPRRSRGYGHARRAPVPAHAPSSNSSSADLSGASLLSPGAASNGIGNIQQRCSSRRTISISRSKSNFSHTRPSNRGARASIAERRYTTMCSNVRLIASIPTGIRCKTWAGSTGGRPEDFCFSSRWR